MPQIAFRADDDLTERLDRLVGAMRKHPGYEGVDVNRSMAIRVLVYRGLASMELQLGMPTPEPVEHQEMVTYWRKRERDVLDELETIRRRLEMGEKTGL